MKSFKQYLKEINQDEWDYYFDLDHKMLDNPFTTRKHVDFVRRYFKRSGKNAVLDFIKILPKEKLDYNRTKHTNSIFFLGILLYRKTNLKHPYFDQINTPEYERFPFVWFLTCLFHDFGFTLENDPKTIKGVSNLNDLKRRYNIQNALLDHEPILVNQILFQNIENYFNYRLLESQKIDHGILGGIYFFDRLTKIRQERSRNFDETLFWGEELVEQYGLAANAIATHNIWLPKEDDVEKYKKYNLHSLVNDFTPISFNNFPLLYILGIVDTIDPIKAYSGYNLPPDEILRNINLNFEEDEFHIKNGESSRLDFNEILKRVDNLNGWLDLDIQSSKNEVILRLR